MFINQVAFCSALLSADLRLGLHIYNKPRTFAMNKVGYLTY
ncbi:hypothetical protein BFV94_4104 [Alteromonas macleodii]|uniref:Uncharacterized protein n=1 Tax=Alteromonas macleodii TaxID=28108 RepID=A0AB36FQ31_ALTMA|nr:hypothetical protein BFV95_4113 [Alteromonas macleodii]OES26742.1 hypothetical protein BFV94_4104 [Alteromonas macleodii]OES27175.1 hypothetical protein BFV93_4102 [Alteromonas macleodii]OES39480.1 hypothetical protein BFV96_4094 [Alteromonas macleodii]